MHGSYDKRVTCNLRLDDYIRLEAAANAAGRRLAPYLRDAALAYRQGRFLVPPQLDDLLARLVGEARRIGTNVNQIAARVNHTARVEHEQLEALRRSLEELEEVSRILKVVLHNLHPDP